MITIEKDKVILPRKNWNRLIKDKYFEELVENLIDSEVLLDVIENDDDFTNIQDYDKKRRGNKLSSRMYKTFRQ